MPLNGISVQQCQTGRGIVQVGTGAPTSDKEISTHSMPPAFGGFTRSSCHHQRSSRGVIKSLGSPWSLAKLELQETAVHGCVSLLLLLLSEHRTLRGKRFQFFFSSSGPILAGTVQATTQPQQQQQQSLFVSLTLHEKGRE